jgi:hypothetical protein
MLNCLRVIGSKRKEASMGIEAPVVGSIFAVEVIEDRFGGLFDGRDVGSATHLVTATGPVQANFGKASIVPAKSTFGRAGAASAMNGTTADDVSMVMGFIGEFGVGFDPERVASIADRAGHGSGRSVTMVGAILCLGDLAEAEEPKKAKSEA